MKVQEIDIKDPRFREVEDMDEDSNYFSHKELISENEAWAELITDEVLSMMIFSDVQDNPTHPYRDSRMILNFRNKFPFNKPTGIDVSLKSVE